MNKRHFITAGLTALALSITGVMTPVATADAQGMQDRLTAGQARNARDAGDTISANRAISIVRGRYPGADVLQAQMHRGASPRWVVTILTREGRRINVSVDARTGAIL